jgi:DNA-binding transcriptional LysR family regulator
MENLNLNWDDLKYFLAVHRNASFAAAAANLHVTHTTVSRRITALEDSMDTQLIIRTEKGTKLTSAGELLVPYAERIESTAIEMVEKLQGTNRQLCGSVRIGAPDGLGNHFLATHMGQFQQMHPQLEVELTPVPIYYSLAKREIDILVTVKKPTSNDIIARKISMSRLGLFASEDYLSKHPPIEKITDLSGHHFVDYIYDLLYDENLKFLREFTSNIKAALRSSTIVGQMNAIKAGTGIGVIPYFMAHGEPDLIPVLPERFIEREFWLQVTPDSRQLARVRATIDFIVAQMEENQEMFLTLPKGRDFSA